MLGCSVGGGMPNSHLGASRMKEEWPSEACTPTAHQKESPAGVLRPPTNEKPVTPLPRRPRACMPGGGGSRCTNIKETGRGHLSGARRNDCLLLCCSQLTSRHSCSLSPPAQPVWSPPWPLSSILRRGLADALENVIEERSGRTPAPSRLFHGNLDAVACLAVFLPSPPSHAEGSETPRPYRLAMMGYPKELC
jgi:hypothetical protein